MGIMAAILKLVLLTITFGPFTIGGSFEYFNMVQQWPKGFCHFVPRKCQGNKPNDFTIHGLWPGNFTQIQKLEFCPSSTTYALVQDPNQWKARDSVWPDLTEPPPNYRSTDDGYKEKAQSFWKHEWKKHGTCSENLYGQAQYFRAAIQLKNQLNLLSILLNAGIHQGHNVALSRLNSTILNVIGKVPDLKCDHPNLHGNQPPVNNVVPVLQEIGICLDPTLKRIIDCPSQFQRSWTCRQPGSSGTIHFP